MYLYYLVSAEIHEILEFTYFEYTSKSGDFAERGSLVSVPKVG